MQIPEVKIAYERFSKNDDVGDGISTENYRWTALADLAKGAVRKAYQIIGIPCSILIDKAGNWQYSCRDLDPISGQPLIWMIEALLSD